jgi:predicted metal-dependent hydrolase
LRIAVAPAGRSTVARIVTPDGFELRVALAPRDADRIDRVLEVWLRDQARLAIEATVADHAAALDVRPAAISLRDPRSRWGSASRQGRLMFSWRLVLASPEALETVVIHELAHLRVFGHGPRFWSLVAGRRPDHVIWRRWLRAHSLELHGALRVDTLVAGAAGS